jgi:hypothetical protein
MQEDYPGDDEHDNEYLDPDLTHSDDSSDGEDDLGKPEPPVRRSKGVPRKTVVPAQKKRSQADTTVLPRLGLRSTSAVPKPPTKRTKSNTNLRVSLQPGTTSESVPVVATTRTKDQSVPENNKKTFELAKDFLATLLFTKNPWPLTKEEKYELIAESWKLSIEAQDCQRRVAGAPENSPSVCQQTGGPSKDIDFQTREAVSFVWRTRNGHLY